LTLLDISAFRKVVFYPNMSLNVGFSKWRRIANFLFDLDLPALGMF